LASKSCVPVFLAREASGENTIVAATDLRQQNLPILRTANGFGHFMRAPVVAVHTLPKNGDGISTSPHAQELAKCITSKFDAVKAVVCRNDDPVQAILDIAERRHPNLVVVGVRQRNRETHRKSSRTAARIANRSRCSVLIAPVPRRAGAQIEGERSKSGCKLDLI
jgi:nucleotide-binding universal stress UspA family protein